jgi:RNA polymerase sigma-70 factor (ECF subfamily)
MIANSKEGLQSPGQVLKEQFEQVFKFHFKNLHSYACTITRDAASSEEIVQGTFLKLWEKRKDLNSGDNISSYLYRAVYNESLNYLKHLKVRAVYQSHTMRQHKPHEADRAAEKVALNELQQKLEKALRELPEQCRTIFQLSRFEDLKYKEIADRLGLSIKTVENQMGKALKLLRLKLVDFLPFILIMIDHFL